MSAIALPPLARLPEGLDGLVHGLQGRWRRRPGSASALRREALACLAACEALRGCAAGDLQARLEQARERLRCAPQQAQGALSEAGVPTAVHYPVPLNRQPAYEPTYCDPATPVSDEIARRVMSLPMSPDLSEADQRHIVKALGQAIA